MVVQLDSQHLSFMLCKHHIALAKDKGISGLFAVHNYLAFLYITGETVGLHFFMARLGDILVCSYGSG